MARVIAIFKRRLHSRWRQPELSSAPYHYAPLTIYSAWGCYARTVHAHIRCLTVLHRTSIMLAFFIYLPTSSFSFFRCFTVRTSQDVLG